MDVSSDVLILSASTNVSASQKFAALKIEMNTLPETNIFAPKNWMVSNTNLLFQRGCFQVPC